jgi:hypothetical protein
MSEPRDRLRLLAGSQTLNGIDFVEVDGSQTRLRVHFVNHVAITGSPAPAITGGEIIPVVAVVSSAWSQDDVGRPVLELVVGAPGDFSSYTLTLSSPVLDPFFDHVVFSFKAGCPSTLDCEPREPACPPPGGERPPIDYLAKDFQSFRKALSDFSALRYPAWRERSEADFGVMFMEALASLADDLSYQQDRIAAEGWIETATQRRSLVRLARLVDYEPRVATAARVWLQFEVADGWSGDLPVGMGVSALDADGTTIDFETGTGFDDLERYPAAAEWSRLQPYWWDDSQRCLAAGATEMWIEDPGRSLDGARFLLIDTRAELDAHRPLRQIVRLEKATAVIDPLLGNTPLVHLVWRSDDALRDAHDLTRTTASANLIPATHGRRHNERVVTSPDDVPAAVGARALIRTGANRSRQYLHTLRHGPLTWLAQEDGEEHPRPELRVAEVSALGRPWAWWRSLLDPRAPRHALTVDSTRYRSIDLGDGLMEYDGGDGDTLRFGDGIFGAVPADGAVFEVTYRAGGGARGNVAAGTIDRADAEHPFAATVRSVSNPLAAEGGEDEEPADRVRELAPHHFRARPLRAVRAEDYQRAAAELPWVQRAGTTFRWTGSWRSVFTSVDTRGGGSLGIPALIELTQLLDRRRLAGYESFVFEPRHASIDLEVIVCARPEAFRGDVKRAVIDALDDTLHADGTTGFFHPDRFSFGMALERSALEAAIQRVPGVDGVVSLRYRRRGQARDLAEMPDVVEVAHDEIVRVDSNPNRPERGSLRVDVRGGK